MFDLLIVTGAGDEIFLSDSASRRCDFTIATAFPRGGQPEHAP